MELVEIEPISRKHSAVSKPHRKAIERLQFSPYSSHLGIKALLVVKGWCSAESCVVCPNLRDEQGNAGELDGEPQPLWERIVDKYETVTT